MLDDMARHKTMAAKLLDQVHQSNINSEFEEDFICSVNDRLAAGRPLTEKQANLLEILFEKY